MMRKWMWRKVIVELVNMLIVLGLMAAFGLLAMFYDYLEAAI